MRRLVLLLPLLAGLSLACSSSTPTGTSSGSGSTRGAESGTGTSTGASTGGGSTGRPTSGSGGASSSGSGASTTAGAGSTGAGSTGGGTATGGGVPCAPGAAWQGGSCVFADCARTYTNAHCLLVDGGVGICGDGSCQSVDIRDDGANCGGYGQVCAGGSRCFEGNCVGDAGNVVNCAGACASSFCSQNGSCVAATCSAATEGQPCQGSIPTDLNLCCGSVCRDVLGDGANCGSCGNACPSGSYCLFGLCAPIPSCDSSEIGSFCPLDGGLGSCCPSGCVDRFSDPANCGACGVSCASGSMCTGQCSSACLSDNDCAIGFVCHAGVCLAPACSTATEGNACPIGDGGERGVCCSGQCIDLTASDPNNCGACGFSCGDGGLCFVDQCQPAATCAAAANGAYCSLSGGTGIGTCCAGSCVDLASDNGNCRSCGQVCPTGSQCTPNGCTASGAPAQCPQLPCPAGTACNGGFCSSIACSLAQQNEFCANGGIEAYCCGGSCVTDPITDPNNCGFCGRVCPQGTVCKLSQCVTADGGSNGCLSDSQCPPGTGCAFQDFCLPFGCADAGNGAPCAFGPGIEGTCCSGTCVDTLQDSSNCDGCAISCGGNACVNGSCLSKQPFECSQSCPTGFVCYGQYCLDELCRGLDRGSPLPCLAPDGVPGLCCDEGACSDVLADPLNCGACGQACPPGQSCVDGVCSGSRSICGPGRIGAYCEPELDPTRVCCPGVNCTDITSDVSNCGVCGRQCPPGLICSGGQCL